MIIDGNPVVRGPKPELALATLDFLEDSTFAFHLTGSHYFGCDRDESDIDFITADGAGVIEWLESRGFTRMGGSEAEYDVPETLTRGVYAKGRVQVQVVYALRETLLARDILATHFNQLHKNAGRDQRREAWVGLIETMRLTLARLTATDDALDLL